MFGRQEAIGEKIRSQYDQEQEQYAMHSCHVQKLLSRVVYRIYNCWNGTSVFDLLECSHVNPYNPLDYAGVAAAFTTSCPLLPPLPYFPYSGIAGVHNAGC